MKKTFSLLLAILCLCLEQTVQATSIASLFHFHFCGASGKSVKARIGNKKPEHAGLTSPLFNSPLTRLPVLANGEAAFPSNANNFHGRWSASVDSRTGNATFSLEAASMLYHLGQSKKTLSLSYTGGPSPGGPDTFGLGPHWSWNVGTERLSTSIVAGHKTTDITTGDGHSFTMEDERSPTGKTVWRPLRHKMGDVIIKGKLGDWTISMATGVRMHLKNGFEDWEEDHGGQKIWFYYNQTGNHDRTRHLTYICAHPLDTNAVKSSENACPKNGVKISYQANTIIIHAKQRITVKTDQSSGIRLVREIHFPSLSSVKNNSPESNISFSYDAQGNLPWLLHSVKYPSGLERVFLYNNETDNSRAKTSGLPAGINGARLPVVTEQITHTGNAAIPDQHLWFYYNTAISSHNYTGYQGHNELIPGKDNLLDQNDSYTYSVTMDNGLTSTTTTYNKYHLPLNTIQRDDIHGAIINRDEKKYPQWRNTVFADLPKNYSLAKSATKTLFSLTESGDNPTSNPVKVISEKKYDDNGQPVWKRDSYGRQYYIQYCPSRGDSHCPPADSGWPDVTRPEKVLVLPAIQPEPDLPFHKLNAAVNPAQGNETVFDYTRLPSTTFDNKQKKNLHFWQISEKTEGLVSHQLTSHIHPGDPLPELSSENIQTQTRYRYNEQQQAPDYGQITQIQITHKSPHTSKAWRQFFIMDNHLADVNQTQSLIFNIERHINKKTGIRQTTINVAPDITKTDTRNLFHKKLAISQGFSLGTTFFSLSSGKKLSTQDSLGLLRTSWKYDLWGRPVEKIVTPSPFGQPHIYTLKYLFTHNGQSIVKTMPDGSQQKTFYGADGKVLSTWHRFRGQTNNSMGNNASWIPDTAITYTVTGQPATTSQWYMADTGNMAGHRYRLTTTYGYDALGRPVWEKLPDGRVNVIVHDDPAMREIRYQVATGNENNRDTQQAGPVLSVTEANILGKPVSTYTLPLNPDFRKKGKYLYPQALREQLELLKTRLMPTRSLQSVNSYGLLPLNGKNGLLNFVRMAAALSTWINHTSLEYDGKGRLIRQVGANNAVTQWVWQDDKLASTIAPDGRVIHDTFNLQGKKISRCVQPSGGAVCHVLGTRGYDSAGHLIWQADENHNIIRYKWDNDGRKIKTITPPTKEAPKGHVFTWHYNAFGMTEAALDGIPYLTCQYDPVTWKITESQEAFFRVFYHYDPDTGFLVKVERKPLTQTSTPIDYPEVNQKIQWDIYHKPVSFTDWSGNRYVNLHDKYHRIIRRLAYMPHSKSPVLLAAISYDIFGRILTVSNDSGITRTLTWNDLGAMASTTDSKGNNVLSRLSYTYDPDSQNILSVTRQEHNLSATQFFRYDTLNNLVSMTCGMTNKPGTPGELCPRETNLDGSGIVTPPMIVSQHYTFDHWNNIKSVSEKLSDEKGTFTQKTVSYTYADEVENQDHSTSYNPHRMIAFGTHWSSQNYSAPPHILTYDTLGRIIRDAEGNRLHYNAFGQQDIFTSANKKITTRYFYDSSGHQIAEQPFDNMGHPLQHPLFLFYTGNMITTQAQKDKEGIRHITAEAGGVAHSEDGVITRWYLHDYKGDVISTIDSKGQQVSDILYSPYGMTYDRMASHSLITRTRSGFIPWWKNHLPEFDNQMNDPATGYQFLGGGYRAYNPVYRHFMSRDSFSPFKKIDGYGFGDNNPIMNTDPTGHMPKWASYLMASASIAMSIGLAILTPVAVGFSVVASAAEAGSSMGWVGGLVYGGVVSPQMLLAGGIGAVAGSLQIASLSHPSNKKLAISTAAFGFVNAVTSLILGASTIAFGNSVMLKGLSRATVRAIMLSGIFGVATAPLNVTASGMAMAMTTNPEEKVSRTFALSLDILNYISTGLMLASLATEVGLGFVKTLSAIKSKLSIWRQGEATTTSRTPLLSEEQTARGIRAIAGAGDESNNQGTLTEENNETTSEIDSDSVLSYRESVPLEQVTRSRAFYDQEQNRIYFSEGNQNNRPTEGQDLEQYLMEIMNHLGDQGATITGSTKITQLHPVNYSSAVMHYFSTHTQTFIYY